MATGTPVLHKRAESLTMRPVWIGYVVAAVVQIVLTAGLLLVNPSLPIGRFPTYFVITVGVMLYLFGVGPAVFAFILGWLFLDYVFISPDAWWPPAQSPSDWSSLITYATGTCAASIAVIWIRRSETHVQLALARAERELGERQRIEKGLRESEEQYRTLVECSPEPIAIHSEGVVRFANVALASLLGASNPKMIIGMSIFDFIHADHRGLVEERIAAMEAGEVIGQAEEKFIRLDGGEIDTEVVSVSTKFEGKHAFLKVIRDITERKRSEQREKEQAAEYLAFCRRTVLAATDGKLIIMDRSDIESVLQPAIKSWAVETEEDVSAIRNAVVSLAKAHEMEESRVDNLALCVGEAVTNALKHAGIGEASIHPTVDGLIFLVSDRGPGIPSVALPEVALRRGYSTAGTLGMGYKILIQLSDRIYLATGRDGTTVAVEMKLATPRMAEMDLWKMGEK